jgi:hypothetical protein
MICCEDGRLLPFTIPELKRRKTSKLPQRDLLYSMAKSKRTRDEYILGTGTGLLIGNLNEDKSLTYNREEKYLKKQFITRFKELRDNKIIVTNNGFTGKSCHIVDRKTKSVISSIKNPSEGD